MVKIILRNASSLSEKNDPEPTVGKGNLLFFAETPLDLISSSVPPSSSKVYLTISDATDIQQLRDIFLRYKDIEIVVERANQLDEIVSQLQNSWSSVQNQTNEKSVKKKFI